MNTSNAVLTQMRRPVTGHCDTEGKYEKICRDRAERDEFDALNRKVDERTAWMEQRIYEQEKKAERRRYAEEKTVSNMLMLIGTMTISATVIAASAALYMTEVFPLWLCGGLCGVAGVVAAFRVGYLWHEIKFWDM